MKVIVKSFFLQTTVYRVVYEKFGIHALYKKKSYKDIYQPFFCCGGNTNEHEYITDPEKKQQLFVMCHWKAAKDRKQKKQNVHKSFQIRKICNFCDVHFCRGCFNAYHKRAKNIRNRAPKNIDCIKTAKTHKISIATKK